MFLLLFGLDALFIALVQILEEGLGLIAREVL